MNDKNLSKKQLYIEWILWSLLFAFIDMPGMYKYIAIVVISIVTVIRNWRKYKTVLKSVYFMLPVMVYCGIGLICSVLNNNITVWTIKTVVFWMLPPLFLLALCFRYDQEESRLADVQFKACVTAYVGVRIGFILINGQFESPFAFVFGLFAIYYIYKHKWKWAVLALLLMYFGNKRIAILAVLSCVILMLVMKCAKYRRKWMGVFWGLIAIANGVYIYWICSGILVKICSLLGIDTSYRLDVYSQLAEHIPKRYYLGKGIGEANIMINKYVDPNLIWAFENPHNDILKTYIELGAVGLTLFL